MSGILPTEFSDEREWLLRLVRVNQQRTVTERIQAVDRLLHVIRQL